jgi:outer membrane lipoprotein SlyB
MDSALRRLALPFLLFPGLLPLSLCGCSEGYSPNTYAATAAQQEATVQRGVIIGVRQVQISATGTIGAATGGAAGGVAGAQVAGSPVVTAFSAIGGTLVGGIGGAAAEQAVADTKGWEYIVQETGDKLVSVTQTSKTALSIGLNVLVISDSQQARVVPDYTVQATAAATPAATNDAKTSAAPTAAMPTEIDVGPLLPSTDATVPLQLAPTAMASDPAPMTPPVPAPAVPAATPPAVSPASGDATPPQAAENNRSDIATPTTKPTTTPVQAEPAAPSTTPPADKASTAPP